MLKEEKKSKKGLIIGIIVAVVVLVIILVIALNSGSSDKKETQEVTTEESPATESTPIKPVAAKPKPPKERLVATGAYNTDQFRVLVLGFINGKEFEKTDVYLKSRKKDAPNENLDFLNKRLARARKQNQ